MTDKLVIFKGKEIRRIIHDNAWYFAVVDIIAALTDSEKPRDYWYRMKKRDKASSGVELSTICRQLKLKSSDGKMYSTEVANTGERWDGVEFDELLWHIIRTPHTRRRR